MKKIYVLILALIFIASPVFAHDITILHTSDVHGRLQPIDYHGIKNVGGASRQVYYYNKTRQEHRNTLVLDSGDIFQGSIYYQMYKGKLTAKLLKTSLKYDAVALGNHEFDRGIKELKHLIKKSNTTFLSANIEFSDYEMRKLVKPFIIKEVGGEKILIIGVTTPSLANLSCSDGITIYDPVSIVRKIISENKADAIIVISHCGYEIDKQIANANPQINLILGGHNHILFTKPILTNGVNIVNSGEFGVRVSKMIFSTDKGITYFENVLMDKNINSDKVVEKKLKHIDKKLDKLKNTVLSKTNLLLIGEQTEIEKQQTNLGRLVLKSMVEFQNYDIVCTNSGSIRINKNLTGKITMADAIEILPFENKIVKGKIQGKYLEQVLTLGKTHGRKYLQVYSKIKKIEPEKYYTIVTNEYISKGKDGYEPFRNIKDVIPINNSQKDAFIQFLRENPNITETTLKMY